MKIFNWEHDGVKYKIRISDRKDKKLMAFYEDKKGKTKKIYFGGVKDNGTFYEHFFDKTGLLDPKLNHNDPVRRERYRKRHKNDKLNEPSAGLLSWHLLW